MHLRIVRSISVVVSGMTLLGIPAAPAAQLVTKGYDIHIDSQCAEGEVTCERVSYHGVNRSSGQSIRLTGTTRHAPCADGVTPCRFLGYEFRNGDVSYVVAADGTLTVTDGSGQTLLHEQGTWLD